MTPPPILWFGLFAAVVARIALGMLWYSPKVFWPAWSRLTGVSQTKAMANMKYGFGGDVVGAFLMAFVLLHAIFYAGARTVPLGIAVAFVNWLGFVATATIVPFTYEGRPLKLYFLYAGYQLVSMLAMGAIITRWGLGWT